MSREISLDEIRRAIQWTTPGTWEWNEQNHVLTAIDPKSGAAEQIILQTLAALPPLAQDADWITHSRTYAEWLIHRVEQLQQENAELAAQIIGHAA